MSAIAIPNPTMFDAQGRAVKTLPFTVAQVVNTCQETLEQHGMALIVICTACKARTDSYTRSVVEGDHDAAGFTMTCACTRRRMHPSVK